MVMLVVSCGRFEPSVMVCPDKPASNVTVSSPLPAAQPPVAVSVSAEVMASRRVQMPASPVVSRIEFTTISAAMTCGANIVIAPSRPAMIISVRFGKNVFFMTNSFQFACKKK